MLRSWSLLAPAGALVLLLSTTHAHGLSEHDRRHDGFYFRAATGFTGYSDVMISEHNADRGAPPEASISGMGTATELALGGTLERGVVVGGGLYGTTILSRTVTIERNQLYARELLRPYQLSVVGPFVDWYFNPNRGFHAQAALGLAIAVGMQPDRTELHFRDAGLGGALVLGFGHEWWATTDWAVGALGRLTVAFVGDEDDSGMDWTRTVVASPGLLLSVTYH